MQSGWQHRANSRQLDADDVQQAQCTVGCVPSRGIGCARTHLAVSAVVSVAASGAQALAYRFEQGHAGGH